MCTHSRIASPSAATAIASSWSLAPSGSIVMTRWSVRSLAPGVLGGGLLGGGVGLREDRLRERPAQSLARQERRHGRTRRPRGAVHRDHAGASAADDGGDEVADPPVAPLLSEAKRRPRLEGGLDGEAAAGAHQRAGDQRARPLAAFAAQRVATSATAF